MGFGLDRGGFESLTYYLLVLDSWDIFSILLTLSILIHKIEIIKTALQHCWTGQRRPYM